ncbi:phage tail protein, partial [Xylella fastidiosa]|nr:phage tail protein [Xylella fastidiosa]
CLVVLIDYCLLKNIDYEDVASWLVGGGQLYF